MPKTTKRAATKRAARIAKAHATELTKLEVKEAPERKRPPGYKPPARGVARYPWATVLLTLLILLLGTYILYVYHVGPFALPPAKVHHQPVVKVSPTPVIPTPTPATTLSPCLSLVKQVTDSAPPPSKASFGQIPHTFSAPPALTINSSKIYCAGINTNRGLIVLELDPRLAPNTVNNFVYLAQHHFYDGLVFHRVVSHFIIQSGDPLGNGTGGPGYKIPAESVLANYAAGTIAMAKQGNETVNSGSQFFICIADDSSSLQKVYNLFGHVVKGMDVVLKIQGPGDDPSTKNIKPDVIDHVIVVAAP